MTPYYSDSTVTIYHADCLGIALSRVDTAVVTDPPYGMQWDTDGSRFSRGPNASAESLKHGAANSRVWGAPITGDATRFDPSTWLAFDEVILWGANHYAQSLPVGTTLVWIKRKDGAFGTFLSDAEIAWRKGGHGVYCRRALGNESVNRLHPNQKPLEIMRWCVEMTTAQTILDPYCGSGTTLRAAKDLGRKAIGIEIEERYCEIAAKRCAQEVLSFSGTPEQTLR